MERMKVINFENHRGCSSTLH